MKIAFPFLFNEGIAKVKNCGPKMFFDDILSLPTGAYMWMKTRLNLYHVDITFQKNIFDRKFPSHPL